MLDLARRLVSAVDFRLEGERCYVLGRLGWFRQSCLELATRSGVEWVRGEFRGEWKLVACRLEFGFVLGIYGLVASESVFNGLSSSKLLGVRRKCW